jgi:hypothetical protein
MTVCDTSGTSLVSNVRRTSPQQKLLSCGSDAEGNFEVRAEGRATDDPDWRVRVVQTNVSNQAIGQKGNFSLLERCHGRVQFQPASIKDTHESLKRWFSPIAFGNQTISFCCLNRISFKTQEEIHGFASLPRDRFALIVCNRLTKELSPRTGCLTTGRNDQSD